MEFDHVVWLVAGLCALASTAATGVLMFFHLRNYTKPEEQKWVLRILLIVPIYAVDSMLAIILRQYSIYFDTLRICYESYVLYAFFQLLIVYAGGFQELALILTAQPARRHPLPLCCLPPFQPGLAFLRRCRQGVLQYVFVNVLGAIATFVLELNHLFHEGSFAPTYGYLYIMIATNVSITVSMYCLVLFYLVCESKLKSHSVVPKFISVKAVIFFSFWQAVGMAVLVKVDVIPALPNWGWTQEQVSKGLQDFIICFEMFIVAVAQFWTFPWRRYRSEEGTTSLLPGVKGVLNMGDIGKDTIELFVPTRVHENLPQHLRGVVRGTWITVQADHNPHMPITRELDAEEADRRPSILISDPGAYAKSVMGTQLLAANESPATQRKTARARGYGALEDSEEEAVDEGTERGSVEVLPVAPKEVPPSPQKAIKPHKARLVVTETVQDSVAKAVGGTQSTWVYHNERPVTPEPDAAPAVSLMRRSVSVSDMEMRELSNVVRQTADFVASASEPGKLSSAPPVLATRPLRPRATTLNVDVASGQQQQQRIVLPSPVKRKPVPRTSATATIARPPIALVPPIFKTTTTTTTTTGGDKDGATGPVSTRPTSGTTTTVVVHSGDGSTVSVTVEPSSTVTVQHALAVPITTSAGPAVEILPVSDAASAAVAAGVVSSASLDEDDGSDSGEDAMSLGSTSPVADLRGDNTRLLVDDEPAVVTSSQVLATAEEIPEEQV